jgi:hypothetical protein
LQIFSKCHTKVFDIFVSIFYFTPYLSSAPAKQIGQLDGETGWLAGFGSSIFGISIKTTAIKPKTSRLTSQTAS